MFATFLTAIVLASLAALAVLLAAPRPVGDAPAPALRRELPWTGVVVGVLLAALGFVGGLLWGA